MAYEQIETALDDGVLTLTLNRPDSLNAYTARMGAELADAFVQADADDAVRLIIVTGAGRGFCAGADMSAGADAFGGDGAKLFGEGRPTTGAPKGGFVEAIFNCRKPSIAAINGGAAAFLPRIVGLPQALRWCYSGRVFGPDEALAGGLVSEVVEPEQLLARATEIAREIADETSAISIAVTRALFQRFSDEADPLKVLSVDGPMAMGATGDVREGVSAFLEKRKPNFPGKVSTDMPKPYPWWE